MSKGEVRIEEPTRAERTIARRAAESRATVPEIELRRAVDMSACVAFRDTARPDISLTALLVRACALALREVPRGNGAYRDGRFELYSRVNIGVAVGDGDTSAVATVFDADQKTLQTLTAEMRALDVRARAGELTPPELSGATFTFVNSGIAGLESSTVVITPPQAAALTAGSVRAVPVVRDGAIVPSLLLTLTLACDQRILQGATAALLINRAAELLEDPSSLR